MATKPTSPVANQVKKSTLGARPPKVKMVKKHKKKRRNNTSANGNATDLQPRLKTDLQPGPKSVTDLQPGPKSVTDLSPESANFAVGSVHYAKVKVARRMYLYLDLNKYTRARAHISELNDEFKEKSNPLTRFRQGMQVKVRILGMSMLPRKSPLVFTGTSTAARLVYDCTLKSSRLAADEIGEPKSYEIGEIVPGFVVELSKDGVLMQLNEDNIGLMNFIHTSLKLKDVNKPQKRYRVNHCYMVKILKKQENFFYKLTVLDRDCIKVGSQVIGALLPFEPKSTPLFVLPFGYRAKSNWTDISDDYGVHVDMLARTLNSKYYQCAILDVDHKKKTAYVSLRPSRTSKGPVEVRDREILAVSDLHINDRVRGFVLTSGLRRMFVNLGRNVEAVVPVDDSISERYTQPGCVVELVVTGADPDNNKVMGQLLLEEGDGMMDPTDFVPGTSINELRKRRRNRGEDEEQRPPKSAKKSKEKSKRRTETSVEPSFSAPVEEPSFSAPIVEQTITEVDAPHLKVSSGFVWDPEVLANAGKQDSSSESEDEDRKTSTKKKRKQRLLGENLSEKKLFEIEKSLMDSERQPESVDEFDRLLLSSPNSSIIWLSYMTFQLQSGDVDKARAVAERALKTISFREEQEKLNVWVALLNLENLYGGPETVDAVFQRAVEYNEPLTIYNHLVTIYTKTDKLKAAEQLYNTMVRRFSDNKDVWLNFGTFLMRNGRSDFAHKLLERSLKSLSTKEHVNVISKFAQLEFKFGEAQRGKTMMESILSSYPKRTDVWSVYLDMMSKVVGDLDETRRIFERVITMKLSAKKMKFFFKRYLEFEKQHGTSQTVEAVKEKALHYVQDNAVE